LFESPEACSALLRWAGLRDVQATDYRARCEADMERLADAVESCLDTVKLCELFQLETSMSPSFRRRPESS